jgi:tripartite-type tricarboxylate transporter receptor subunit TctC
MNSAVRFAVLLVAGALASPMVVLAQKYPEKPVRVVIVFPPGGSNDVVGRIVFQKVSEIWPVSSSSSTIAAVPQGRSVRKSSPRARPTATR